MKKKNNFLKLGIFAMILVLGVGYATLTSQTLKINGTAAQSNTPIDVQFTKADTPVTTDISNRNNNALTATAEIDSTDTTNKTAKFDITNLEEKGDTVVITYTVKNFSKDTSVKVYVANSGIVVSDDALSVSVDKNSSTNALELAPEASGTVVVTATLTKTPTDDFSADTDSPETVTITLTADPVTE